MVGLTLVKYNCITQYGCARCLETGITLTLTQTVALDQVTDLCIKSCTVQIFELLSCVCLQHDLNEAVRTVEDAHVKHGPLLLVLHVFQQQVNTLLQQTRPPVNQKSYVLHLIYEVAYFTCFILITSFFAQLYRK